MPIVSVFFGIVIRMFYREHGVPHFHATYQGEEATFTFDGHVLAGSITSRTALRLIREWAVARKSELSSNWERTRKRQPLVRIDPLE